MKLKNSIINSTSRLALSFILCFSLITISNAQPPTIATPSTTDQFWYTTTAGHPIWGINTAMIAYGTPMTGLGYFFASSYTDGTGSSSIQVLDPVAGLNGSIAATGTLAGVPDVIIGNNNLGGSYSPTTDFILATAYVNSGGHVEIDYYDVYDDGLTMSVNTIGSPTVISGSVPSTSVVHLDVIAEFDNTGITGTAFCNKFVVTWDDVGTTPSAVVMAAFGDLNTQSIATPVTITPLGVHGVQSDVAAIRRHISGPPHALDYTAWITYVNAAGGNQIFLTEWDFTTNAALSTITLEDGLHGTVNVFSPRIDAFDSYDNSIAHPAHYKVVAQDLSSSSFKMEIRNYDNNLYGSLTPYYVSSQYIDVTSVPGFALNLPPYDNFLPAVAAAPAFAVFHSTPITTGNNALFMEPIDVFTSQISTAIGHYFWVNSDGAPTATTNLSQGAVAVSTPPNWPDLSTVYAWAFYNGTDYEVDYKNPVGYSFRKSQTGTAILNTSEHNTWKAYPNPAVNEIMIDNSAGGTSESTYEIIDASGHVVLKDCIGTAKQAINIHELIPGNYILKMHSGAVDEGYMMFVKQ